MQLKEYLSKIHGDKEKLSALKAAAEAGKDQEFLAAEGVELPEQAAVEEHRLSDDELTAVAGGEEHDARLLYLKVCVVDEKGRAIRWRRFYSDFHYEIIHYECERCGRILHAGSYGLYYCDPCDEWYSYVFGVEEVVDEKVGF